MDRGLFEFTRRVIQIRNDHPVFRRRGWFKGRPLRGKGISDIAWFRTDGGEMSEEDWQTGFAKSLMVFLNGDGLHDLDEAGKRIRDASFLLLFNAHHEALDFTLPAAMFGNTWQLVLDTAAEMGDGDGTYAAGTIVRVGARSVVVLSHE
jgi:glycogen operon protein